MRANGYRPTASIARDWPEDIAFSWIPPQWPDPRAPPFHIQPRMVPGPRLCSQPLEPVIKAIAHNEKRTPGEVLREIAVMALMVEGGGSPTHQFRGPAKPPARYERYIVSDTRSTSRRSAP
ncbi:hypothetical protein WME76_39350 [Sorangium sp. So ce119]|uniref:hypothetical protein n=1 Tax=Sorangium sp. So ce119 TaxID=3133279 RepID=UPI003F5D5EF0